MRIEPPVEARSAEPFRPWPWASPAPILPLVLLVDDDRRTRRLLRVQLGENRLRVVEAETGGEALVRAATHKPEVILLNFLLPDSDAVRVTTKLRESTMAPVLILSALDREGDKIRALDAGANDFLTKPFGTGELLARIRVWLRHTRRGASDSPAAIDNDNLRIDFDKRLAFASGREVRLTPTQYKLFALFMRNAGKVLTHEQILLTVWGPAYTKETQYLRVYMGQLRQKFEDDPTRPTHFVTEPGVGYRLCAN